MRAKLDCGRVGITLAAVVALALVSSGVRVAGQSVPVTGVACAGNTIYTVCVDAGDGFFDLIGHYTARTGPAHPVPDKNVLYGGEQDDPGTSFNSVRSFTTATTGRTYTQGPVTLATSTESPTELRDLNAFVVGTEAIGTTGFRTTWHVTGAMIWRSFRE